MKLVNNDLLTSCMLMLFVIAFAMAPNITNAQVSAATIDQLEDQTNYLLTQINLEIENALVNEKTNDDLFVEDMFAKFLEIINTLITHDLVELNEKNQTISLPTLN